MESVITRLPGSLSLSLSRARAPANKSSWRGTKKTSIYHRWWLPQFELQLAAKCSARFARLQDCSSKRALLERAVQPPPTHTHTPTPTHICSDKINYTVTKWPRPFFAVANVYLWSCETTGVLQRQIQPCSDDLSMQIYSKLVPNVQPQMRTGASKPPLQLQIQIVAAKTVDSVVIAFHNQPTANAISESVKHESSNHDQ